MVHYPENVTPQEFVADIRAILAANPDATNPVRYNRHGDADGCAYLDDNGRRCVIGEYLHRQGLPATESEEGNGASAVMDRRGYPYEVRRIAGRIQTYADGSTSYDEETGRDVQVVRTWGEVLARLDRLADLYDHDALAPEEEVVS